MALWQKIEKAIFDTQIYSDLKTLAINYRPREAYAYMLGCLRKPEAYVYDLIHDAAAESTINSAHPNIDYLVKAYNFKRSLLPGIRLDILSWYHAHSIDHPSAHMDIPGQKNFRKIYKPSFATIMNYNTLEMKCFDVVDDKVVIIPHEVKPIPQEIRKMEF